MYFSMFIYFTDRYIVKYNRVDTDRNICEQCNIKIINYSNNIRDEYLSEIINMLPNKYKELNVDIYILNSRFDKFKFIENYSKPWIEELFDIGVMGCYNISTKRIFIYGNKFDKCYKNESEEKIIIRKTFSLLHEIRHAYQYEYMKDFIKSNKTNNFKYVFKYNQDKREIDANEWARDILNGELNELIENEIGWEFSMN